MIVLVMLMAIIPGLLISYLIYRQDRYDKEPKLILVVCFLLGMLSTVPAIWVQSKANEYGLEDSITFWSLLLVSFGVVAFIEELVKFLCLLFYAYPRKAFNEPLDGIVYAVMIGMGFATLENVLYADRFGWETTLFRAFTAVPAHGVFAVFVGYYTGLAKFDKERRVVLLLKGFGLAVLVHGIYDFFILQEYAEWLMSLATLTLFVSIFFAIRMIKLHQQNSPFRNAAITVEASSSPDDIVTPIIDEQLTDAVIDEMGKLEEEE